MSEVDQKEAQFVLQRIYVKDMSFESPKAPDAFLLKNMSNKIITVNSIKTNSLPLTVYQT